MTTDKPYGKHEDKITLQGYADSKKDNNDPAKTHIVFNEIGNNAIKLEKIKYHGTKNLNILDSNEQQKDRF